MRIARIAPTISQSGGQAVMTSIRAPAVSGTFYPADAMKLQEMVDGFIQGARHGGETPKAIIAPHAGFIYSGPVAASAYARLETHAEQIKRVILVGPSHRVGFNGLAAPDVDYFETPLGRVSIDQNTIKTLLDLPWVRRLERAHVLEHSLEVQLPFLQTVLNDFSLIPLVVGHAEVSEVAQVIERLWGGDDTLIVISSDLSHYLDYNAARAIDAVTSKAIEEMRDQDVDYDQACGALSVRGLLRVAKKRHLHCETVDLRNSGDTAGSRDSVVGYGAYVFS